MKREKKENGSDLDRVAGVLAEHFDSKVDLVIEGQSTLYKKIEDLRDEIGGLRAEMNYKFEAAFDELHLIRNELKEKVSRDEFVVLEKRVIMLEKRTNYKG